MDQPAVRDRHRQDRRPRLRVLPGVRLAAGRRLQRPDRACRPGRGPTSAPPCTSPATPPRTGRRSRSRSATRRASRRRPACPRSATTSAASTTTARRPRAPSRAAPSSPTTCTPAGCSSARSSRSTGCTATTATGCPGSTATAAKASAEKFLNLREKLRARTRTPLAEQADRDRRAGRPADLPGVPGRAGRVRARPAREYLYGPDVLVAPVTTPGDRRRPRRCGSRPAAVDGLLHRQDVHRAAPTQNVTTDLDTMPVFIKAGAIMPTRTDNVTNDVQNPLTKVTLDVAGGRGRPLRPVRGHRRQHRRRVGHDADRLRGGEPGERLADGHAHHRRAAGRLHRPDRAARVDGQAAQRRVAARVGERRGVFELRRRDPHADDHHRHDRRRTRTTTIVVTAPQTNASTPVGGTVPATLSLTLGAAPSFGAFTPGVEGRTRRRRPRT